MTLLKWPIAFTFLAVFSINPVHLRAAESGSPPRANADSNLIQNGSFNQWLPDADAAAKAGFVQNAPVAWKSRTHALTLREGKPGTKPSDYTYRPDSSAGGIQAVSPAADSLVVQVQKPDIAYRIFQEFPIQPGTYLFSGGLGVAGSTSGLPSTAKYPGEAIPWKITLELLDVAGNRVSLTTLTTASPTGTSTKPEAAKFKPATVTVPAGVAKASFSIWCYGGNAYGHIDNLALVKQP